MKVRATGLLLVVATLVNCGDKKPMTLFSGRRSFVVTSTLTVTGPAIDCGTGIALGCASDPSIGPASDASTGPAIDGGTGLSPTSQVFTLIVDGDQKTAIWAGASESSTLQPSADGFLLVRSPPILGLGNTPCGQTVYYKDLTVTFDASGGLSGHGSGLVETNNFGDYIHTPVAMSLVGVPDTVPPTLTLTGQNDDPTDPFNGVAVTSSEPLSAAPVLRSAEGDIVPVPANVSGGDLTYEFGGNVLLRYGEQYRVDLSGVSDLAGNAAVDNLTYTTRPPPPLVAPDGFESVTDAMLGDAQVLSDPADPIISGTRSLYIPPVPQGSRVLVALRLAIPPGATTISLAYRTVNADASSPGSAIGYASVGGRLSFGGLPNSSDAPATGVIGGTQVTLGPVTMATMPLPPDATDEIVIHYFVANPSTACAGPGLPTTTFPGLIIDDLRVSVGGDAGTPVDAGAYPTDAGRDADAHD
jgi:hypothetical protein